MELKIISWNIRGLNSFDKINVIKDIVKKERVSVIAIQETKMSKVSDWFIKSFWGSDSYDWLHIPSNDRSGGIILVWDDSVLKMERELVGEHSISIEVSSVTDNFKWLFSTAYAPNSPADKLNFLEELELI
ncbi:hypothetical protein BVC80_521g126 [Macleaya cordata]|uniref:Endonuclease/exonuclease/phosphatase domain-containing protein n=1 Tax=Macleaya cordata TaxID=56857 RepID=A0A200R9I9_MACCD|nr:hypothetical protein BVC80_521g126 [Macleaya cordata]